MPTGGIGFCFGGGDEWPRSPRRAAPRRRRAVLRSDPDGADFSRLAVAAVLGVYAELDDRVNATATPAAAALEAARLTHELRTFDGVDHAFFNDTGPRYDAMPPPRRSRRAGLVRRAPLESAAVEVTLRARRRCGGPQHSR